MLRNDPRRIIFIFFAGMLYALLFLLLYAPNLVKHSPVVIYDADQSALSRAFCRNVTDVDTMKVVQYVTSEEEMRAAIRSGEAVAAIDLPPGFEKKALTGQSTEVLLLANATNLVPVSSMNLDVQNLVAQFSDRVAVRLQTMDTGVQNAQLMRQVGAIHPTLRVMGNPLVGYLSFMLIGLGLAAYQQGIFFAVGASIQQEYRLEREASSPARLFLSKILFYWVMACIAFLIAMLTLHFLCHLPLQVELGKLALLGVVTSLAVTSFGFLFAAPFRTELRFIRISTLYPVLGFILSGFTWPIEMMPRAIQYLSLIIPQTYFARAIRQMLLLGDAFRLLWSLRGLLLLAALCQLLGYVIFTHHLRRLASAQAAQN